jgi:hypothetical protein
MFMACSKDVVKPLQNLHWAFLFPRSRLPHLQPLSQRERGEFVPLSLWERREFVPLSLWERGRGEGALSEEAHGE